MQFKYVILFVAAAVCAVQASSEARARRSIDSIVKKATSGLRNGLQKVEDTAQDAIRKAVRALEDIERTALGAGTSFLKGVGVDVDLQAIADVAKANVRSCAASDEIQRQANAIKDNVLSCVTRDINNVKTAIEDVKKIVNDAKNVPKLLDDAVQVCKKGNIFKRLRNCAKAVGKVVTEGNLTGVPVVIARHAKTVAGITASVNGGAAICVKAKVATSAPAMAILGTSMAQCVQSGTLNSADLPDLGALTTIAQAADFASKLSGMLG